MICAKGFSPMSVPLEGSLDSTRLGAINRGLLIPSVSPIRCSIR